MKGYFITFEGGEGSGKSSAILEIQKYIEQLGLKVITTREPGGIKISEQIRNVILDVDNTDMAYETEALLYAASRVQHLKEKVVPALEKGYVVLCDRYIASSIAYQGYARGLGVEAILGINMFALKYMPDVTYFIDVKPDIALKRLNGREKVDRLDLEKIDFHNRVYSGYMEACKLYPSRIISIDGTQNLEKIISSICENIKERMMENGIIKG